ncbi:MAG: HAD-IB family hydrolase [Proteobacteria bacterium]|nr:MAG: HAD-IB family hydrolase [Pseudomonadota bacterium]
MCLDVYDLDKTLLNGDSNELWHEYLLELKILNDDFVKKDKILMDLYAQGKLNMDEYLDFALDALSILTLKDIEDLMPNFLDQKIKPIIHKQALKIIKKAKHKLIISATPEFIVKPISTMLGIDECIGIRLRVKNQRFTSTYEIPLSYKEGKIECLKQWLKQKDLKPKKINFYSDSINDLPLLEYANKAFCVNPDAKLRAIAKQRNWAIFDW